MIKKPEISKMSETFSTYLQDIKQKIDTEIENILKNSNPLIDGLYKSALYSSTGGKRVRAVFTYLTAELFDINAERLLQPATALELVHAASLIMDDLPYMDDSQLRRGKPANHVVFGQDVALLASVGLLSDANRIVIEDESLSLEERSRISLILSNAYGFGGLVSGQFVDLKLKQKNIDFEIIEFINQKKTAALFTAAGRIAAVLGKASDEETDAVRKFAEDIGFAFQIVDDMLDISGDEKIVGKNLAQDKMNFVKLVGVDEAKKYLTDYQKKATDALDIFGDKAKKLKSFSEFLIERAY